MLELTNIDQTQLQGQLDAFLATAEDDVLLWHDAAGHYSDAVGWLGLPGDVRLVREDFGSRFGLACVLNDVAPDERVLFYRSHPEVIEARDWFCDLESRCPCFHPSGELSESALRKRTCEPAAGPAAAEVTQLPELDCDWYPLERFDELAGGRPAEEVGFRSYADCVVRVTFGSLWDYYDSIFLPPLVGAGSLPDGLGEAQSFRMYVYQRLQRGTLFSYDADTWITPSGLAELEISDDDVSAFAGQALAASAVAGISCFTVPWLQANAPELPLLQYGLDDRFYESVLFSCGASLSSGLLCKRRIFAPKGEGARGRDLVRTLVQRERSPEVDGLLAELADSFGVALPRGQLLTLARKAGLFFSPEFDRIYPDHQAFIDEVE